ncbi:MAG TPA: alpha/beta fold hydrolase [Stellaceae bacterium]|jgi:hypothetical protein
MEQAISFISDGLALRGFLHLPEGAEKHSGLVLCHGFGGSCQGAGHPELAKVLERAGYVVLRFDFRGCGQSEGRRGDVIVDEEIADLRHAIDFLEAQPSVDAARIGVIGASLGGSVAIEVAARDARVRICVANGSVGNGERRYRAQYPDDAAWQAFLKRLDEAKRAKAPLDRFEIVYIPESDRAGLPPGAIMEFTAATAQSLLDSCPEHVVTRIAPRPLLLVHPRGDRVVPFGESEALAAAAGPNCEKHIIEGSAHFGSGSAEISALVLDFLRRHLPA